MDLNCYFFNVYRVLYRLVDYVSWRCIFFPFYIYEPVISIRYNLACAYSNDSNHSVHPHSLIRVLVFQLKKC